MEELLEPLQPGLPPILTQHTSDQQPYKMYAFNGYPVNSGDGIRRLSVGYRTGDHTGSSVPVTAEGPGALLFTGYMDQTDIFFKMAAALSNDTTDLDKMVDLLQSAKFPKTTGK